ncbi:SdpI family protein [Mesobacillus subterraneus]|uniref:SdpI family protein n=1 Tax=Mesobacillus subterraneus TaxID=285983 RepID=A0A3R9KYK0_9BACI|nr:SdpI family protein [Mesobacillus subterraneus]RSD29009.1 SdpI family protein [Mesobacillus subterraneus]
MNEGVLFGVLIFIPGIILFLFPPKEINYIYGYRTPRSMRNKENWEKANKYSSRLMIIFGLIIVVISLVFKSTILNLISLGVSIILIFILVEMKISKN